MLLVRQRLTLAVYCCLLVACGSARRYTPPTDGEPTPFNSEGSSDILPGPDGDSLAVADGTTDRNPSLEGLSTSSSAIEAPFPNVKFELLNVPQRTSDLTLIEIKVDADASISHVAYKIGSSEKCQETSGYVVQEVTKPIILQLGDLTIGSVYLCANAWHFPTKRWQNLNHSKVYNWQRITFKRVFSSYYEMMDDKNCVRPTLVRVNSTVSFSGTNGTNTWTRQATTGCNFPTASKTDVIRSVQATASGITGIFQDGVMISMWFHWTYTNAERTLFKGSWGYGELDDRPQGVWNSK